MTTPTHDVRAIAGWLYATLTGDATLMALLPGGVNDRVIGELANRYPALVYQLMSARDVRPANKEYVYSNCLYLVKVIDRSESFAAATAAMDRVDGLLDNTKGTAPTGEAIVYCQREEQVDQNYLITGVSYRELGSIFRIWVQ